ncbi:hypothetical protein AS594_39550 [Streptomyces agglomeratus]|uniref:Uncharacterized protein n=1 Tax=Streptomyces agglomeratus TaxID=285458 RepID=A0A1E5NZD2_9ACTN|nr:hypothetical protein [Streptomyces agglomeratus]OEJ21624.1 hypothetical protein AS594_39550 [Streptomyces agglomeratus]
MTDEKYVGGLGVKLRAMKVGALEVRHEALRLKLLSALKYVHDLHVLEYASYGRSRRWVLSGVVEDMTQAVFAWRRGERALPEPNGAYQAAKNSFDTKMEEWEIVREDEEADPAKPRLVVRERSGEGT